MKFRDSSIKKTKKIDQKYREPRIWSNEQLKKISYLFTGDIANISAGDDVDKQGSTYREYFSQASSYTITNFGGATYRGFQKRPDEIELDLTSPLPDSFKEKFDVVFNHTTLEHIFEVRQAFHNLCELSRDVVILVVPFCQVQHETEGYLDYWRFTPTCIRKLFADEGFEVIYEADNNSFNTSVYLLFVASQQPIKWINKLPLYTPVVLSGTWIGSELSVKLAFQLFIRACQSTVESILLKYAN